MSVNDTIVAVATPPGRGGIGIVRISGNQSFAMALALSRQESITPRVIQYSNFYDLNGSVIDQGLLLYFKAPQSFTGEDVIELQTHGAPIVLDELVQQCVRLGARIARPGEFSERAFLNDKMDLTQAEAIADLIDASSQTAARMAVRSLQGAFSQKIKRLHEQMVQLRLYVEAAIDFPEEEIDFLNDGKIAAMLEELRKELEQIQKNAYQGTLLQEGLSIVIAGRPNAGKSTLINALSGRDVAIVTDVAGTTRDVMREQILIDDLPIHVIDTAGLRESEDVVEKEGIKRAWQALHQADCVLLVIDAASKDMTHVQLDKAIKAALPKHVPIIRVLNKIDALGESARLENQDIYLSAKQGDGIALLKEKIKNLVGFQPSEGQFIARRRHVQALETTQQFLNNGKAQLKAHQAGELLAEDLRLAHQSLGEITGEFSSDDLLGEIFSSFCIGK